MILFELTNNTTRRRLGLGVLKSSGVASSLIKITIIIILIELSFTTEFTIIPVIPCFALWTQRFCGMCVCRTWQTPLTICAMYFAKVPRWSRQLVQLQN